MSSRVRHSFHVVGSGAEWALYVSLVVGSDRAGWSGVIARTHEPLLLVRDDELAAPRPGSLEVRGSGLWADVHCHERGQRWQVNFEGFVLALDAGDVGGREVGDLVAVEFEFEWDAIGPSTASGGGSVQRCMVDGEARIGIGGGVLALDAPVPGWRGEWPS